MVPLHQSFQYPEPGYHPDQPQRRSYHDRIPVSAEHKENLVHPIRCQLTSSLAAFYSFEKDLERDVSIETRTGIRLNKPCWAMGLELQESDLDTRIAVMIHLKGIGEFGSQ